MFYPATTVPTGYIPATYESMCFDYNLSEPIPPRPTEKEVLEYALGNFIDLCKKGETLCSPSQRDLTIMIGLAEKMIPVSII